jgi:uncharacterized protein involved in cysteine biosynthesis
MRRLRLLRNLLIVAMIAAVVAFAPGGGNGANTVLTALTMGFLVAIGFLVYGLYRQNQLTLAALSDGRRAILFGALGLIALLIAGTDEFFNSGGGTLAWVLLLGVAVAAIWRIWLEASSY